MWSHRCVEHCTEYNIGQVPILKGLQSEKQKEEGDEETCFFPLQNEVEWILWTAEISGLRLV